MSWVYILLKKILASQTIRKLEMIGSGKELAKHMGQGVPESYGGKGAALGSNPGDIPHSVRDVDGEAQVAAAQAAAEAEAKALEAQATEIKAAEDRALEEKALEVKGEEKAAEVNGEEKAAEPVAESSKVAETGAVAVVETPVTETPEVIKQTPVSETTAITETPVVENIVPKDTITSPIVEPVTAGPVQPVVESTKAETAPVATKE